MKIKTTHEYSIKIGVSSTADGSFLSKNSFELAKDLGKEISDQGGVLVTGATTGFPYWSCMGAKESGGISIGYSPASNMKEHVEVYRAPLDYLDLITYTGMGYPGRDLIFVRSVDALVVGPGRIGSIHEFTIAYEDEIPLGILENDDWETDEILRLIISKSHRQNKYVVFDKDPRNLITKLMNLVREKREKLGYK